MKKTKVSDKVLGNKYENSIYPQRNPEEESKTLYTTLDNLDIINHYCFGGKESFNNNFRLLIAGCGIGDETIFLAEQLRDKIAEVIVIDENETFLAITKKRAEKRKLKNIQFLNASILHLPKLKLKPFDFILCPYVLNDLTDPAEGLNGLKFTLKKTGAMLVTVDGNFGKRSVNRMQAILELVNQGETNTQAKIDNAKLMLDALPQSNLTLHELTKFEEIKTRDDIGIYNLLLQNNGRSFNVEQIYQLVENAELKFGTFLNLMSANNTIYDPLNYLKPNLELSSLALLKPLKNEDKAAVADRLGDINKHYFTASCNEVKLPDMNNLDNIIFIHTSVADQFTPAFLYQEYQKQQAPEVIINCNAPGMNIEIRMQKTTNLPFILSYLDGENTILQMMQNILDNYPITMIKPTADALHEEIKMFYNCFAKYDILLLRHKSVPKFSSPLEIQMRLQKTLETV